jgi:hypothetical protein
MFKIKSDSVTSKIYVELGNQAGITAKQAMIRYNIPRSTFHTILGVLRKEGNDIVSMSMRSPVKQARGRPENFYRLFDIA